jgi:hypothetical protein
MKIGKSPHQLSIAKLHEATINFSRAILEIKDSTQQCAAVELPDALSGEFATAIDSLTASVVDENLQRVYGALAPLERDCALKGLGFGQRDIRGVALLLDQAGQYSKVSADLANAQGAADAGAITRMAALDERLAVLRNRWDLFKEGIGDQLIGPLTVITSKLSSMLSVVTRFAEQHPTIVKLGVAFVAISAALAIIAGGAIAAVGGLLAFGSFIGISGGVLAAIAGIGTAVAAVGAVFVTWHTQIGKAFEAVMTALEHFGGAMYTAGAHLMSELARGIGSAVMAPVNAIENVTRRLRGFFPFSPAHEGPLADLHRTQIVQTIAASIKPTPLLSAMHRLAQAAAIAIPVAISMPAVPALAAAMPIAPPARIAALNAPSPVAASIAGPTRAQSPTATRAPIIVNVTHQVTINGSADSRDAAREVIKALDARSSELGHKLADAIDRELQKRARGDY